MHFRVIPQQTHHRRWLLILLSIAMAFVAPALTPLSAAPPVQSPVVIDATDDDPENKIWNCETNRVPFGNEETDRSRCFTFRYAIPPEGISSATVHLAIDTLGSLQDTDATVVAVAAPVENCAWAIGGMKGCVVLHGGFQGEQQSLNLNLLDIACDPSIPNPPEAQQLVLDALDTGVLHMLLQDDTALYSAQLVLNGGDPAFTCGTSTAEVSNFIPTPGPGTTTTQGAFSTGLDQIFDPPQYLVHATGHATMNGPVADDWYFLFPKAPDPDGFLELPDGIGGTFTYTTDYFDGPFNNPREVCEAAGARVGDTPLQSWDGGDAFQCNPTGTPAIPSSAIAAENANPIAQFLTSPEMNELLTGTTDPIPPDQNGATTAAVAGAVALGIFAVANYLISSGGFVKSATANAMREHPSGAPIARTGAETTAGAKGSAATDASASNASARGVDTGGAAALTPSSGMSANAAKGTAPDLRANSEVRIGAAGASGSGDWKADALDKAVKEGVSAVPDAKDLVQDKLVSQVEKRDKRERLLADQVRLKQLIKTREQGVSATRQALELRLASGEDVRVEQQTWLKARDALNQANEELQAVVKELAALDEKQEDKK